MATVDSGSVSNRVPSRSNRTASIFGPFARDLLGTGPELFWPPKRRGNNSIMGQDQSSAPLRENGRDPTLREDSQTGVVRPATGLSCPLQLCKILVVGDVGVGKVCYSID